MTKDKDLKNQVIEQKLDIFRLKELLERDRIELDNRRRRL